MKRVLLVGKGEPDRGGIPTFLHMLVEGELSSRYRLSFLNVAHHGVPEGGELTRGNVIRTLRDARAVFVRAREHDIVHIHSALAPSVTTRSTASISGSALETTWICITSTSAALAGMPSWPWRLCG